MLFLISHSCAEQCRFSSVTFSYAPVQPLTDLLFCWGGQLFRFKQGELAPHGCAWFL